MTGAGLVTALGGGVEASWKRLLDGDRGLGPVDLCDTAGLRATSAAQVRGLRLPEGADRSAWSRTCALAAEAADEALRGARIDPRTARVGLVVGVTTGGMFENEARLAKLHVEPHAQQPLVELLSHPLTATGDRL